MASSCVTLVALLSVPSREATNFNGVYIDSCKEGAVTISASANVATVLRSRWPQGLQRMTGKIDGASLFLVDAVGTISSGVISWANGCRWTRQATVANNHDSSVGRCTVAGPIFLRQPGVPKVCAGYTRTCELRLGGKVQRVNSSEHVVVPKCLAPDPSHGVCLDRQHLVQRERPEGKSFWQMKGRSIYLVPNTNVMLTLPALTNSELWELYGSADMHSQGNWSWMWKRALEQSLLVMNYIRTFNIPRKMTIVEMGCATGYLMRQLLDRASEGGQLVCFEADPAMLSRMMRVFAEAHLKYPKIRTRLVPDLMDFDQLENSSVDLFMSSHSLEHLPDICTFLEGAMRVLKPGGLVFIEVPVQQHEVRNKFFTGAFHLSFFTAASFQAVMEKNRFEMIYLDAHEGGNTLRSLFRKPVIGNQPAIGVSCGGHLAETCDKCTWGHGASWCNGECRWVNDRCVHRYKQELGSVV